MAKLSFEELRKRAEKGDVKAQVKVGDAFFRGQGLAADPKQALAWYERAGEAGNLDAMQNVSFFYSKGYEGACEVDLVKALDWSKKLQAAGRNVQATIDALEKGIRAQGAPKKPLPRGPLGRDEERDAIERLVSEAGLGRVAEKIGALMRDSARIRLGDAAPAKAGASRFGGDPDLPAGTAWPAGPKGPLSFLAQIDLADVGAADHDGLLPDKGLLSFFWDAASSPWGLDAGERGSWRVLHLAGPKAKLAPVPPPKSLKAPNKYARVKFEPKAIAVHRETTLPFWRTHQVRGLGLTDPESERYQVLWGDKLFALRGISGPRHRMLGHADGIQGDMQRKAEYVRAGAMDRLDDDPDPKLDRAADDWVLLLQIDTDEGIGANWGEGALYFWIRQQDLSKKRFDDVWAFFQA